VRYVVARKVCFPTFTRAFKYRRLLTVECVNLLEIMGPRTVKSHNSLIRETFVF